MTKEFVEESMENEKSDFKLIEYNYEDMVKHIEFGDVKCDNHHQLSFLHSKPITYDGRAECNDCSCRIRF